MHREARTGRRITTIATVLVGVGASIAVASTAARADLGHGKMTFFVPNAATYGDPVMMAGSMEDASFSCSFGDCDQPNGTVTISLNGVPYPVPVTPGLIKPFAEFTFTPPFLSVGSYAVEAAYTGNFSSPVPEMGSLSVGTRPCNTILTQSIASTSMNGAVTLSAKVSSSTAPATGTVVFYQDDGTPALDIVLATANVDPTTNTATSADIGTLLPAGTPKMYAKYSGDINHEEDCRSNNVLHNVQDDPPPTAADDSVHTPRGTSITFDVLANDADPGGGALIGPEVDGAGPEHGQLTGSGTALVYLPDDGFVGDDSFDYYVTDSNGTPSALATVAIEVTCDSVPANDIYSTAFQTALVVSDPVANLLTNDDTCERAVQMGLPPAHGTISGFDGFNGLFTYTPDAGYFGPDTFIYAYTAGIQVTAIGHVAIIVQPDPDETSTSSTSSTTASTSADPTTSAGGTIKTTQTTASPTADSEPVPGTSPTGGSAGVALPVGGPTPAVDPVMPADTVLPNTGGDADAFSVLVGTTLVAAGLALIRLRRRSAA